jgi:hypothetical protein
MKRVPNDLIISTIILTAATAFFIAGLIVGGFGGFQMKTSLVEAEETGDSRAEYYRGVYDVCIQQTRRTEFCLNTVLRLMDAQWYEKPSVGWEWPLTRDNTVAQGSH